MKQNIAFLIAAHTDVMQLKRLMDALITMGDVYLHIDKKVKDKEFLAEVERYRLRCAGQVTMVKRIGVTWGGFSQCVAQRELLRAVFAKDKTYDRVFFLSGLDYPVLSAHEMEYFLDQNKEKEFVPGWNLSESAVKNQLYKVKYFHLFRDVQLPHNSFWRRAIIVGTRWTLRLIGLRKKPYLMVDGKRWNVFFGSQWTSMTGNCARHVLNQMEHNKTLWNYFNTAYAPDELFVPTIVHNSVYAKKVIPPNLLNTLDFNLLTPLHYLRYEECIRVWDENAYDDIIASGKPFVRKLVSGKSERLIEMLEKRKQTVDCRNK